MSPEEFKKIRKKLGWSLKDCSQFILQSERNIRRMEDGTRPVMPQTAKLMMIYSERNER